MNGEDIRQNKRTEVIDEYEEEYEKIKNELETLKKTG